MTGKLTWLAMLSCALLCAQPLWGQAPDTASDARQDDAGAEVEELIVRGRRPSELKAAVEAARIRVYDVFNALNSDDAFDVHCRREAPTGRRMRQQVCRPRFKNDISSAAARAFVSGIKQVCPGDLPMQDCIFGSGGEGSAGVYAQQGVSRAQGEETRVGPMQQLFVNEFARVVLESPELQQEILEYEALERAYREARGGRRR